jgi:hypothetical protein
MFKQRKNALRLLLEQSLRPIQGDRFQPTGFADLGTAPQVNMAVQGQQGTQPEGTLLN